jgi:hypothetical protein
MTKDQLVYQVNQLSPRGAEALIDWVATLPRDEQQIVLEWADEQRRVLQKFIDETSEVRKQVGEDFKS